MARLLLFVSLSFLFLLIGCSSDDPGSSPGQAQDDEDDDNDNDDDNNDNDDNDNDNDDDNNDDNDDDTAAAADPFLRDEQGRAMILHGCNFDGNAKGDSGLPQRTEADAIELAEVWGFNFARYLIFWARIEPTAGVYDEDYLDAVEERLDWLGDAGIAVVLDMHQDLWGPFITEEWGGSDGAPEWATITDDWPYIPFSQLLGGWAFDYLSPAVIRAFDNFWSYDRHPELQDHYAAMWAHVAERFHDHPAVLGYDLMNEPWQGSGLLRYRDFDQNEYSDFNQRLIDALRQVDADRWIFYEPTAFLTNQGGPMYVRVLDDPRAGPNRLAYFPHLYPLPIELAGGYLPEVDHTLESWERHGAAAAERQGAPLLAGEWSMLSYFDDDNHRLWVNEALRMLERVSGGWSYWDCSSFQESADATFQAMVAASYPRRVAGTPVSYGYDPAAGALTLVFDERPDVTGPTEIYLAVSRDYPAGWTLEVSDPAGAWSSDWDEDAQVLSVWTDPNTPTHTIVVAPAAR